MVIRLSLMNFVNTYNLCLPLWVVPHEDNKAWTMGLVNGWEWTPIHRVNDYFRNRFIQNVLNDFISRFSIINFYQILCYPIKKSNVSNRSRYKVNMKYHWRTNVVVLSHLNPIVSHQALSIYKDLIPSKIQQPSFTTIDHLQRD